MIPKNIFQTHKSLNYIKNKPKVAACVLTWAKCPKDFNYYFYDDNACDIFMKQYFDNNIYTAYSKLPISVMKADLWRYCVIYKYGGIYADTDTIRKVDPNIFITDSLLMIVPENSVHLCQWIFSAPPNSPILKSVIDLSVERILSQKDFKGEHLVHNLTGPAVFTDGIEKYLKENNKPTFNNKKEYYKYPDTNLLRVFNADYFHNNIVTHIFTGQDYDGWTKQRDKLFIS